jgi:hypothetical protein
VLVDGIAGHTQPPGHKTDISARFLPAPLDHHAAFLANRRAVALRAGRDAITGKGLQHILDVLPDNFAACLSHSMLNGLAKLLQIAWPAFCLKDAERN